MSAKPATSVKSAIPVAKPAAPRVAVGKEADEPIPEASIISPANIKGTVISLAVHAVMLIVLALWYFTPSSKQPPEFDTKVAGTELGVPEGMNTLGGLDTPINMPTPPPDAPREKALTSLRSDDIKFTSPDTGFTGVVKNPGSGDGGGFGLAKFGDGTEMIGGVEVKVGDPQFTLKWDTKADLDLHVVEPGGKEIYWLDKQGNHNGELDVDNRDGLGPENIYWLKDDSGNSKVKGLGPAGEYHWWVYYYGSFDGVNIPTRWKVRIKHDGREEIIQGTLNHKDQSSKRYTLKIGPGPGRVTVRN